jgi:hypothetical protein
MGFLQTVSRFLIDPTAITIYMLQSTLMLENSPNLMQNISLYQDFQLTQ